MAKVIHLITRLIHGGADQNTLQTCLGLSGRGYAVVLVTGREVSIDLEAVRDAGVEVEKLESLKRNVHPLKDFKAMLAFYRFCKRHQPGLVHTHTAKAGVIGRLGGKLAGVKYIVHGVHGSPVDSVDHPLKRKLLALVERATAFLNDYYISVGEDIFKKYCQQIGLKVPENYRVARSAFDVEAFANAKTFRKEEREKYSLKAEEKAVGMIGRVAPQKGYEFFLELCMILSREVPNLKFFAVGSIDDERYYRYIYEQGRALIEKGALTFLGQLSYSEVPRFIAAMDVIVHTALWEGLPRVVAESLVGNKPVVSFAVEGAQEVIEEGVNGFIVPTGDVDIMAEKVKEIISAGSPENIFPEARTVNNRLQEEFSMETMVDRVEEVYKTLWSS